MCCNRGPSSQSSTLLGSSRRYFFRSLECAGFIWTENRLALFGDISFPLQCPSQNQRGLARRLQVTAFGLIYVEESARSKNEAFGTLSLKEQMKKTRKDWHVLAEDKNCDPTSKLQGLRRFRHSSDHSWAAELSAALPTHVPQPYFVEKKNA